MKASRALNLDTQIKTLLKKSSACGGVLRSTRKGRQGARRLTTEHAMHLVLRSSKAKGAWSFLRASNKKKIQTIIKKHAHKNLIQIISVSSIGQHLHLQIRLSDRKTYKPFIRAMTGAIALQIMGANRNRAKVMNYKDRFWDYRPFSKILTSFGQRLRAVDIALIHQLEGLVRGPLRAHIVMAYRYNRLYGLPAG